MDHRTIAIEFEQLADAIDRESPCRNWVVLDLVTAPAPLKTWYVVSWPGHVRLCRYNGDATFQGPMTEKEARTEADIVYGD